MQQQRVQDAGVFGIEICGEIVAPAEAAMEGADGGRPVVHRVTEGLQSHPGIEADRCRAIRCARPYAETGFGQLLQGYTEASNVDAVTEISALIIAQRAYEMNSKVIQAADQMSGTISNLRS